MIGVAVGVETCVRVLVGVLVGLAVGDVAVAVAVAVGVWAGTVSLAVGVAVGVAAGGVVAVGERRVAVLVAVASGVAVSSTGVAVGTTCVGVALERLPPSSPPLQPASARARAAESSRTIRRARACGMRPSLPDCSVVPVETEACIRSLGELARARQAKVRLDLRVLRGEDVRSRPGTVPSLDAPSAT
jgi:hypothetical protein